MRDEEKRIRNIVETSPAGDIFRSINKLHHILRDEFKKTWKRTLPFNEEVFDRWEKARYLGFGKGASVYDNALIFGEVKVGAHTWVGPFTILDGTGGLEIGSYCSISAGVQIYSHDSVKWAISGGTESYEYAPVKIGDRCYIGPNAIITKGVAIGEECIIGANSVILNDIPAGSKVINTADQVVKKYTQD